MLIFYVDFLRDSLWAEFKMGSTELDVSDAGKPHEATYYAAREDDGSYRPSTTERDRSFLFGGGGFISTPSDLIKMGQATYDSRYLSSEMRSSLRTPVKLGNGEVNEQKYSLGWRTGEIHLNGSEEQTWTALHHGGVTEDASTAYLLVIPDCEASIAFATNYVPPRFWEIRGELARFLINSMDVTQCSKADQSVPAAAAAALD